MEFYEVIKNYIRVHGVELVGRLVVAVVIVIAAMIVARVAKTAVGSLLYARSERRAATLAPTLQSLTVVGIMGFGIVMALHQLGLNVTTVIAGAGVLGLAVGFGAQALVRDVISGFFLIIDGIIEQGDHVTVDSVSGIVEQVGLRVTQIRSFDGRLWYVPNGELKVIGNFNRDWARAEVKLPVAFEQDVNHVMSLVQRVGDAWAAERSEIVLETPEVQGVLGVTTSGVEIRLIVKVRAMEHWAVERELTRRIKEALDRNEIETPIPRQVIYHRGELALAKEQAQ